MTPDTIRENLQLAAMTAVIDADRRRSGRRAVSPELVHLLRAPLVSTAGDTKPSALDVALLVGLLLTPLWIAIGSAAFGMFE